MTRSIKSWILTSILLSLCGALIGAVLATHSISRLSRGAEAISAFERQWSSAIETDLRASSLAHLIALEPTPERMAEFESLNSQRSERFLEAVASAPKISNTNAIQLIYDFERNKGETEAVAVTFAANNRLADALQVLSGAHYKSLAYQSDKAIQALRDGLTAAMKAEQRQAAVFMISGILVLFLCVGLAGSCWWRVGRLFRDQAIELAAAHQELAVHAIQLEKRISERTADLEAAKTSAEAADRAKSQFLAQMSHEIRTPLNGVLGMTEALSNTSLDERQTRMLDVVRDSGATLLALLNDVLDLAKIESGKLDLEHIPFQIEEIVRSAEAVFTNRAHEKGISLVVRATGAVDSWCLGDPTRLRQVLYNLVSNAVKFTESGGVEIELHVSQADDDRQMIAFDVRDSGIGMDSEAQSRLFQRFSQGDASTTRKFGGSGLGLAICQQLLTLMGGRISVASVAGGGSVFSVQVELESTAAPERSQSTRSLPESQKLATGDSSADRRPGNDAGDDVKILAADDNAHNRLVLQLMLEQFGLEAVFVVDGAQAVEAWQTQHFDLVLMDIQMPIMSGHDATRAIRKLEAAGGRTRTPIIALTANAMTHHITECVEAGMDAHVAKPIRPDLLFAAIEQALDAATDFEPDQILTSA